MPTVLKIEGYRFFFFFYSGENNERPHIHVEWDDKIAKYWLAPVDLASSRRFRAHELNVLVVEHRERFLEAWHDHFDSRR
jgi:hypothetical protein